jgi:YVTN family beta-propeller protein
VINTSSNTVVHTITGVDGPRALSVTPDGTRVYVANRFSDNASVIDTTSNTVIDGIAVGTTPYGIAITPDGSSAYVTNLVSNNVSVIDTASDTVVKTVTVGNWPLGVAVTPDGTHVYVANSTSGSVSVIDTGSNTVVDTVVTGGAPSRIAITPPPITLVKLSSFTAMPASKQITLQWTTESEIDNAGFNIYRAESEDGESVQINSNLIPAGGSPTEGTEYEFVDRDVKNRNIYYYMLEDIDLNGLSTMHGPVSATPRMIYEIIK